MIGDSWSGGGFVMVCRYTQLSGDFYFSTLGINDNYSYKLNYWFDEGNYPAIYINNCYFGRNL